MPDQEYKYQVALSFSGKDREIARSIAHALLSKGINVFYDEWAKADLWGKDLFVHLHDVYSANARFCLPLLSKNYTESKWTKHELKSAYERSLENVEEYILPIRLDNTKIPGLHSTLAYIDYNACGPGEIAELIAQKLTDKKEPVLSKPSESIIRMQMPEEAEGFIRNVIDRDIRINESDLITGLDNIWPSANNRLRYNFANDLSRHLGFKFNVRLGPVYTAWRINNSVMLSTLPSVGTISAQAQTTYEFEIYGGQKKKLALLAEWTSAEEVWQPIPSDEFHHIVKGVCADRSGCDMIRESTIRCLQKRGAHFRFPVSPADGISDNFCEWLEGPVQSVLFDWDRNPRLVEPGIGIWDSVYHEETGEGILLFIIHGCWSNNALFALEDALDLYFSKRYRRTPLLNGAMRICVHLSNTPPVFLDPKAVEKYNFDENDVWLSVGRVYAAIGRMVAAQREIPVNTAGQHAALRELNSFHLSKFEIAVSSLEGREYPERVKDKPSYIENYGWVVLRHSPYSFRINVENTIPRFDFGSVVTRKELTDFIAYHETQ